MKIRTANPFDTSAIQHVLRTTWQDTYGPYLSQYTLEEVYKNWQSIEFLAKQIENPEVYFPLAEVDEKIVGLATARLDGETILLFRIYALPEYQGQGIGSQLLGNVIDRLSTATKIRLSVEKMNNKAKNFYESQGFTIVGGGQEKVGDEVIDEYYMEKELIPPSMSAVDALELYHAFERLGAPVWIDGGWGVDALLGEQTRSHQDLDIVVEQKDLSIVEGYLREHGYTDVPRDDTSPWNFILNDVKGHSVDFHVIELDGKGNGLYGPSEKGDMYHADALTGIGTINGQQVRCISPKWMVKFHKGYKLRDSDHHDVTALCEKFGIELPEEYK